MRICAPVIMAVVLAFAGCGGSKPSFLVQPPPPPPPPPVSDCVPGGPPAVFLDPPVPGQTQLSGHVCNADDSKKIVIFALTNQFYVQPFVDAPFTNIVNGKWENGTHFWNSLVVLLVDPANYTPAATEITNPALDANVIASTSFPIAPVSVNFGGRVFGIKVTGNDQTDQFDPGPNFWSNDPSVVSVDADGLHLNITLHRSMATGSVPRFI